MQIAETISFLAGVTVSLLFYLEYRRVEAEDEREEMLEQLLS